MFPRDATTYRAPFYLSWLLTLQLNSLHLVFACDATT